MEAVDFLGKMVCVCAGANKMEFWASFLSGVIAGLIFITLHYAMLWFKVDDPVDAVAVHFGGGFWGLIATPFFSHGGILYDGNIESALFLAHEMAGACAIIVWGVSASCVMFGTLKFLGKLRVSEQEERKGLDIAMHSEPGYHPLGWNALPPGPQVSPKLISQNVEHNQRKAYVTDVSEFTNPAFLDTENGMHSSEASVRL